MSTTSPAVAMSLAAETTLAAAATSRMTTTRRVWQSEWGCCLSPDQQPGLGPSPSELETALVLSREILMDEQELHPAAWLIWQAFARGTTDLWGLVSPVSKNHRSQPEVQAR